MHRVVSAALIWFVSALGCGSPPPRAMPVPNVRTELRILQDAEGNEVFQLVGLHSGLMQRLRERLEEDNDAGSEFLLVSMRGPKSANKPTQAEQGDPSELPVPILGTYTLLPDGIQFKPRFPISRGVVVDAYGDPLGQIAQKFPNWATGRFTPMLVRSFVIPKKSESPTTRVTAVYPSAEVLPENLLKFYIHFSAPMSRGMAYDCVKLYDAEGKEVEMPFLELPEELWDPSGQRLTLLLDPGRIKSELLPRREVGPALQMGGRYALVVAESWLDAEGKPLTQGFRKEFTVGPPDTTMPRMADWLLHIPPADSRKPLTITFPEPLDHGLLERVLAVFRDGKTISGRVRISDHERRWQFIPDTPWIPGDYAIVVETILEDLAGNNLKKPFEVDLLQRLDRANVPETESLPFRIPQPR